MQELFVTAQQWLVLYGLKVVGAIVILVVGLWAARGAARLLARVLRKAKVEETLVTFSGNTARFLFLAFVVIAALNQLGVQTTSLIAVLGAASLAVGLALRNQLSSLAAGVLLLLTRPFKIGDLVELAGTLGTVEAITMLNTRLKVADGTVVILSNTTVYGSKIVNYFTTPERRIQLVFGIDYSDDVQQAKKILLEIMEQDERVLSEPEPTVWLSELADSSVNLIARCWVDNRHFWAVRCDLLEKVKAAFDQAGISFPFPQQDVHLKGEIPLQSAA